MCRSLIPFYEEFNNQKWEKFNSEKKCEITYARIQGKQALIAHFQNSSLMSYEDKKCRPIIFHSDGPNQGEQKPFPVPPLSLPPTSATTTSASPSPSPSSTGLPGSPHTPHVAAASPHAPVISPHSPHVPLTHATRRTTLAVDPTSPGRLRGYVLYCGGARAAQRRVRGER